MSEESKVSTSYHTSCLDGVNKVTALLSLPLLYHWQALAAAYPFTRSQASALLNCTKSAQQQQQAKLPKLPGKPTNSSTGAGSGGQGGSTTNNANKGGSGSGAAGVAGAAGGASSVSVLPKICRELALGDTAGLSSGDLLQETVGSGSRTPSKQQQAKSMAGLIQVCQVVSMIRLYQLW